MTASTPSPLVLINASPQINGVNITKGTTVTVTLASNAGVYAWDIFCIGTDEFTDTATINSTVNINHSINSATFSMPNYDGSALIFKSIVNNGADINGVVQPDYVTTFGTYTLVGALRDGYVDGYFRVGAQNETTEGDAVYGWVSKFNPLFRNIPVPPPPPQLNQMLRAQIEYVPHGGNWHEDSLVIMPIDTSPPGHNPTNIQSPFPAPPVGSIYIIIDGYYSAGANNIHIDFLGATIDGSNLGYNITTNNGAVGIIYLGLVFGSPEWKILWEKV